MTALSGGRGGIGTFLAMGACIIAVGLMGLLMCASLVTPRHAVSPASGSAGARRAAETMGNRAEIQAGLTIRDHAAKHNGETERIYQALLAGKCAGSMTWCGGSDLEKLHICVDPMTGAVGAVIQFGMEITTGYYEQRDGYWLRRVEKEGWEVCK